MDCKEIVRIDAAFVSAPPPLSALVDVVSGALQVARLRTDVDRGDQQRHVPRGGDEFVCGGRWQGTFSGGGHWPGGSLLAARGDIQGEDIGGGEIQPLKLAVTNRLYLLSKWASSICTQ